MTEEERENQAEGTPPEGTPTGGATSEEVLPEGENRELTDEATANIAAGPRFDQDEGRLQSSSTERNTRKERVGMVVSDATEKTITVSVEALTQHKLYKKRIRRSKKFLVHDEQNEAHVGDTVRIIETRPLSKRKRWRLGQVVARAE